MQFIKACRTPPCVRRACCKHPSEALSAGARPSRLRNLRKVYDDVVAVAGNQLYASPGSVHRSAGRQRRRQDTTISMLMGLVYPTSGVARVFGRRHGKATATRFCHRLNFESPYVEIPMRLTVRQNLEIFAGFMCGCRSPPAFAQRPRRLRIGDLLDRPSASFRLGRENAGQLLQGAAQ